MSKAQPTTTVGDHEQPERRSPPGRRSEAQDRSESRGVSTSQPDRGSQPAPATTTPSGALARPQPPPRVVIEHVSPEIDAGRFPAKRVVGDARDGRGGHLHRGPRPAGSRAAPSPRRGARLARDADATAGQRRWAAHVHRRRSSAATSTRSKPGSITSPPGATGCGRRSTRARTSERAARGRRARRQAGRARRASGRGVAATSRRTSLRRRRRIRPRASRGAVRRAAAR